jgi:myosin-5
MEDSASVNALRDEVALLKEQLNRANALQSLTRNARPEPPLSPTQPHMNGGLRTFENGAVDLQGRSPQRRRLRRHSNAGVAHDVLRDSLDERMVQSKTEANGPRPMSMAVVPGNDIRLRDSNGHPISYEDPAEELVRLLEHQEGLDREVLVGLIRDLRIVSPSLNNPPSYAEVMFPAHIISIVTNEMWKFGLIEESERFLANAMQNIQMHVMVSSTWGQCLSRGCSPTPCPAQSFKGEDAIIPGIYWLSNVHEILSFVSAAEADVLAGFAPERGPDSDPYVRPFDWATYERLVTIVKHDLDSLEYNIYLTFMQEVKRKLAKMVIPALIESQALPGFVTNEGNGRLFGRILGGQNAATPAFGMDDILNVLNKVHKALKSYYLEESVVQQVINELLKLIGVTSFNDMLMRRNFCSWKRGG